MELKIFKMSNEERINNIENRVNFLSSEVKNVKLDKTYIFNNYLKK